MAQLRQSICLNPNKWSLGFRVWGLGFRVFPILGRVGRFAMSGGGLNAKTLFLWTSVVSTKYVHFVHIGCPGACTHN